MSAEENESIVRRLLEEPWTNLDAVDDLVCAASADARIKVGDQVAEGDKVATRWTGRGTHDGEPMGIAPTGKRITVSDLVVSRLADGKVVEESVNCDTLGMLRQLGAVPARAGAQRGA